MKNKALKPHIRFRAQLHLQTDCASGLQRIANAGLEVAAHGSAAVVGEELEDVYADVWGAVASRFNWEEQFRNPLREEGDEVCAVIDDEELSSKDVSKSRSCRKLRRWDLRWNKQCRRSSSGWSGLAGRYD